MRTRAAFFLAIIVALLAGCGGSSSDSPPQTATPAAVSYADPAALFAAIEKVGAPKVERLGVGTFPSRSMPSEAHAQRGTFMVAIPEDRYMLYLDDGTPACPVITAVFPDAASRQLGTPYGQHMASALGYPSIWQLQGPNWLIWVVDEDTLRAIQGAIGGSLSRTSSVTPSGGSA